MKARITTIGLVLFMAGLSVFAQSSWVLPKYEKHVLRNGLTLYLMEQHEVPLISTCWMSPAGAMLDGTKSGLSHLTAEGLGWGTASYSKDQIDALVDSLGASLNRYSEIERAGFTCQFAAKDQSVMWKLLSEMVLSPSFPEKEFQKEKSRLSQELVTMKESPRSVMSNYWRGFMYANHPYASPSSGTEESVKGITREDVTQFFTKNYTAAGSALIVVGDFDAKAMKKDMEARFGSWKTAKPSAPALSVPPMEYKSARAMLVNKSDSRETRFMIGGKGIPRNHPDYAAVQVVNTILGGRFTSWLNTALRINSGLSYGARSNFACDRLSGTFAMSSFTATETTEKAIDLALQVLDSLHQHGPDAATLASAKNYLLGGFAPDFETSDQLAWLLSDFHLYGLDEKAINEFSAKVEALDQEGVKKVVQKYFPRENLQFLVIGKGEEIRGILKKYGAFSEKDIMAPGY